MAVFTEIVAGLNPEIPRHKEYGPNSLDELWYKEYLDSAERWVKGLQFLQWGIVPGIDEDAFYRNGINDFVAALESIQLLDGSDANASREAVRSLKRGHARAYQSLAGIASDLRWYRDGPALSTQHCQAMLDHLRASVKDAGALTDSLRQLVLGAHAAAYEKAAQQHRDNQRGWLAVGGILMTLAVAWVPLGLELQSAAFTPALPGVTSSSVMIAAVGSWALKQSGNERRYL